MGCLGIACSHFTDCVQIFIVGTHWDSIGSLEFITCENVSKAHVLERRILAGGFKYVFLCSPLCGENSYFGLYFSKGLKPPTRILYDIINKSNHHCCFIIFYSHSTSSMIQKEVFLSPFLHSFTTHGP